MKIQMTFALLMLSSAPAWATSAGEAPETHGKHSRSASLSDVSVADERDLKAGAVEGMGQIQTPRAPSTPDEAFDRLKREFGTDFGKNMNQLQFIDFLSYALLQNGRSLADMQKLLQQKNAELDEERTASAAALHEVEAASETTIAGLRNKHSELARSEEQLRQKLGELSGEKVALDGTITAQTAEISRLNEKLQAQRKANEVLQAKLATKKEQVDQAYQAFKGKHHEKECAKGRREIEQTQKTALQRRLDAEQQAAAAEAAQAQAQTKLDQVKEELTATNKDSARIAADLSMKQAQVAQLAQTLLASIEPRHEVRRILEKNENKSNA